MRKIFRDSEYKRSSEALNNGRRLETDVAASHLEGNRAVPIHDASRPTQPLLCDDPKTEWAIFVLKLVSDSPTEFSRQIIHQFNIILVKLLDRFSCVAVPNAIAVCLGWKWTATLQAHGYATARLCAQQYSGDLLSLPLSQSWLEVRGPKPWAQTQNLKSFVVKGKIKCVWVKFDIRGVDQGPTVPVSAELSFQYNKSKVA